MAVRTIGKFSGRWAGRFRVGAVVATVEWMQRHMRVNWRPGAIAIGRCSSAPIWSYVPLFPQLVRLELAEYQM